MVTEMWWAIVRMPDDKITVVKVEEIEGEHTVFMPGYDNWLDHDRYILLCKAVPPPEVAATIAELGLQ